MTNKFCYHFANFEKFISSNFKNMQSLSGLMKHHDIIKRSLYFFTIYCLSLAFWYYIYSIIKPCKIIDIWIKKEVGVFIDQIYMAYTIKIKRVVVLKGKNDNYDAFSSNNSFFLIFKLENFLSEFYFNHISLYFRKFSMYMSGDFILFEKFYHCFYWLFC